MPMVSVIIPCFNQGCFLSEAINSVYNQTHSNWECIVINDGSADDTENIALEWAKKDERIKYVYKDNGGLGSARNEGLRAARGNFIQLLDADDMIESTKFSKQLSDLQGSNDYTVAISDHFPFEDTTKEFSSDRYLSPFIDAQNFKKEIITEWEFRKSIPCHNFLIPRKIIADHQLSFNEKLPNHEDWVFWSQLLYYTTAIYFQYDKLALYRMRSTSMTRNKEWMAKGFLSASFVLEEFYTAAGKPVFVSYVKKIRKEIKNNLFPHSKLHNSFAIFKQRIKNRLRLHK